MKHSRIFCVVIFLIMGLSKGYAQVEEFIIGGENTTNREIPYQAAILNTLNRITVCSGAIVDKNWIITSRVCATQPRPNLIRVGSIRYEIGGRTYGISKIELHPDPSIRLALIKTALPISFNRPNVRPVDLPIDIVGRNVRLLMTGWGRNDLSSNSYAAILQKIQTTTISRFECNTRLNTTISPSVFCTLNERNKGMCTGDSGNPMVTRNILYGIATTFRRPCTSQFPVQSVQVFSAKDWIKDTVENK